MNSSPAVTRAQRTLRPVREILAVLAAAPEPLTLSELTHAVCDGRYRLERFIDYLLETHAIVELWHRRRGLVVYVDRAHYAEYERAGLLGERPTGSLLEWCSAETRRVWGE